MDETRITTPWTSPYKDTLDFKRWGVRIVCLSRERERWGHHESHRSQKPNRTRGASAATLRELYRAIEITRGTKQSTSRESPSTLGY